MSVTKFYNLGKNKLFGICRSITDDGVRKTLKIIKNNFKSSYVRKNVKVLKSKILAL